ncbi:MAG: hypothetical protein WC758_06705 [Candidatus Woesearchaeota archaeon]|jgi:hypothetical protein
MFMATAYYKVNKKENRFFNDRVRSSPVAKKTDSEKSIKELLNSLSLDQLKVIAKNHGIVLQAVMEKGLFEARSVEPTKYQYVEKLLNVVDSKELKIVQVDAKVVKKGRRQSNNPW